MQPSDTPTNTRTGNRNIDYQWNVQDLGAGCHEVAVLSCGHDSSRKQFYARLSQQIHEHKPNGIGSISFGIFGGVSILREHVERYSAKRLDAFAARALSTVRAAVDERVDAQFAPSDRSCGCTGMHHASGCEVYAASVRSR